MLARWAREPEVAAAALLLERRCLALNERVQLFGRHAAIDLVTSQGLDQGLDHGLDRVLTAFRAALAAAPVSLYEVRRIIYGKGIGWRSVRVQATGTETAIGAALHRVADEAGTAVRLDRHGIARAHVLQRQPGYPTVEHFYVAAPAGARDKERPGFAAAWNRLVTHPQHALF